MILKIFSKKIKSEELISSLKNTTNTDKARQISLAEIGIFSNVDELYTKAKSLKAVKN